MPRLLAVFATFAAKMIHKRGIKIVVWMMLCVFAYFYCGNTMFTHTHVYAGSLVVHSHPYIPANSHTHLSVEFQYIATINMAGSSMLLTDDDWNCCPELCYEGRLRSWEKQAPILICPDAYSLRAPPAAA